MIVAALGMVIPLHDHTLLFIIMCWSLYVHRWIFPTENEDKRKSLINCGLLFILSIYAYVNSQSTMTDIWIRPPQMLYYHLFFILHRLNQPVQSQGTVDNKNFSFRILEGGLFKIYIVKSNCRREYPESEEECSKEALDRKNQRLPFSDGCSNDFLIFVLWLPFHSPNNRCIQPLRKSIYEANIHFISDCFIFYIGRRMSTCL